MLRREQSIRESIKGAFSNLIFNRDERIFILLLALNGTVE